MLMIGQLIRGTLSQLGRCKIEQDIVCALLLVYRAWHVGNVI
jgi:hypothetical protein